MTRRTRALLAVVALLMVPLAACGSDKDSAEAVISIKTFAFDPDPLTVAAGTTITFENADSINHSVTAGTREDPTPEEFDGLLDGKGTTFELTLDEPGTYGYFCRFHPGPGMTAEIIVEQPGEALSPPSGAQVAGRHHGGDEAQRVVEDVGAV